MMILVTGASGSGKSEYAESLNVLSREYCEDPFPAGELGRRLAQIRKIRIPRRERYVGNILAASSFAVFFGGGWKDALISGIFAVAISLLQDYVELICMNVCASAIVIIFNKSLLLYGGDLAIGAYGILNRLWCAAR